MFVWLDYSNQPIDLNSQHIKSGPFILQQILNSTNDISQGPLINKLIKCLVFLFSYLINSPENSLNNFKVLCFGVILDILVKLSFLVSEQLNFITSNIIAAFVDLRDSRFRVKVHRLGLFGKIYQQLVPYFQ